MEDFLIYPLFKFMKYIFYAVPVFLPLFAHSYINNASDLISSVYGLISSLIPIVATLSLVVFFWGIGIFVLHSSDTEKRTEGRRLMFWGIIAIFVMFCIWGIISFISSDLGLKSSSGGGSSSFGGSLNLGFSGSGSGSGGVGGSGSSGGGSDRYRYYQPSNNPNDNSSCLGSKTSGLHWSNFLGKDNCY